MGTINWALVAPLMILQAILMIIALVDLYRTEETRGPKLLWVFIIIFINIVGPVIYFVFGRKTDV